MEKFDFTKELKLPVFQMLAETAMETGTETYLIGGWVRDVLLNRPTKDIDVMVMGSGITFANAVAQKSGMEGKVQVFESFGTAMLILDQLQIEFVGARKESYRSNSRKPIIEDGSLADDQNRRDFTINAMAISLNQHNFGQLLDPFNGLQDLQNHILRTPLEPELTFSDDPLRMMRAIRFSCQLDFTIEESCITAIQNKAHRISIVSEERITDELNKIILSPNPAEGFYMLHECGLLKRILPELEELRGVDVIDKIGHKDNFHHTLLVLENISHKTENLWLRWSALLHDIAKPKTKKFVDGIGWTFHGHEIRGSKMAAQIFRRLRLPMNDRLKFVQKLISLHLRPARLTEEGVTDSAVRRLLFEAGEEIDDLMMLAEADITSKNHNKVKNFLRNFEVLREKLNEVEEKDRLRNWQPPISGELIMEVFGISPCKEVGVIKTAIREAILEGIIDNDYEQAYAYMLEEGKKLGFKPSAGE